MQLVVLLLGVSLLLAAGCNAQLSGGASGPIHTPARRALTLQNLTRPPAGALSPNDIKMAYNFPRSFDSVHISPDRPDAIAFISPYHYPEALNDFNIFSKYYGLRRERSSNATASSNKVFQQVYVDYYGEISTAPPPVDRYHMMRTVTGIQWSHAISPKAKIFLVEAQAEWNPEYFAAVFAAATKLPKVRQIVMCLPNYELFIHKYLDALFKESKNIVFLSCSGGDGSGIFYPSSSPNVVAVGGTALSFDANRTEVLNEVAESAGGLSKFFAIPAYQAKAASSLSGILQGRRGIPDVSVFASSDLLGVAVYISFVADSEDGSFQYSGWTQARTGTATSVAIMAGMANVAHTLAVIYDPYLANSPPSSATFLANIYKNLGNGGLFRDITQGNLAMQGYDLATGVGAPISPLFTRPSVTRAPARRAVHQSNTAPLPEGQPARTHNTFFSLTAARRRENKIAEPAPAQPHVAAIIRREISSPSPLADVIEFRNRTVPPPNRPNLLHPADIYTAYNIPRNSGSDAMAVISPYHYPEALNDFNHYSKFYGLRTEPSSNPTASSNTVFQQVYVNSFGKISKTPTEVNREWNIYAALGTQLAHAIAPNAKIYLVEAQSANEEDVYAAVVAATKLSKVRQIVLSQWTGRESIVTKYIDTIFRDTKGIVFFAGSNVDDEGRPLYPSSSPHVVSVGGTSLYMDANRTKVLSETAETFLGGGLSKFFPIPAFQAKAARPLSRFLQGRRGIPDISVVGDGDTGLVCYFSFVTDVFPGLLYTGFLQNGGPVASAAIMAGIANVAHTQAVLVNPALANSPPNTAAFLANIYKNLGNRTLFRDISQGPSGSGNKAKKGYDLATGVGAPTSMLFARGQV